MAVNHGGKSWWGLTRRQWRHGNGTTESPLACKNLITHFLRDNKLLNYELRSLSDVNRQPLCVDGLPRVLETAVGYVLFRGSVMLRNDKIDFMSCSEGRKLSCI
jgi:hypothetical protein